MTSTTKEMRPKGKSGLPFLALNQQALKKERQKRK